jgi:hypothetical protein
MLKTIKPIRTSKPKSPPQKRESIAPSTTIPRPPPNPFSGRSNPDANAIRAATSLLQMQKAKALADLETLEILKRDALAEPEKFIDALAKGGLAPVRSGKIIPVLSRNLDSENGLQENEDAEMVDALSVDEHQKTDPSRPRFPPIPTPQNIVRMPPVNWAKYGIVGDALDKMHEEQRTNPTLGDPEFMAKRTTQPIPLDHNQPSSEKAPRHVFAAPYNPLEHLQK